MGSPGSCYPSGTARVRSRPADLMTPGRDPFVAGPLQSRSKADASHPWGLGAMEEDRT